jgi:hypothetical protein
MRSRLRLNVLKLVMGRFPVAKLKPALGGEKMGHVCIIKIQGDAERDGRVRWSALERMERMVSEQTAAAAEQRRKKQVFSVPLNINGLHV